MSKYIELETCFIFREKTKILIYDENGDIALELPNLKIFTDSHIKRVIEIANKAFNVGVECGKSRAQHDIRKALGIEAVKL